jgi:lysine-specific demethylase/histidyl-hydroxylase NO66
MTLAALLGDVPVATFGERIWGRESRLIDGAADRFAGLIGSTDIDRILRFARPHPPHDMMLVRASKHYDVNWIDPDGSPRSEQVRTAWGQGYTIVLNDVARYWEPVAQFCAALRADLHHPVDANLYFTPPGTQGFDPHFDVMDVFVLQLEGSKDWTLWGQGTDRPLADDHVAIDPARLGDPLWQGTLHAGQALYIPRGHIHAARAIDVASLHLTIGVKVITWLDLIEAAARRAREDRRFRESLPPGFFTREDELAAGMADRAAALPPFLTADAGVAGLAGRLLDTSPLPRDDLFADAATPSLDTPLARRAGIVCTAIGDAGHAMLRYNGGMLAGPAKIAPAIALIAARQAWRPADLPALGDNERLVLARRLMRDGVVECVANG